MTHTEWLSVALSVAMSVLDGCDGKTVSRKHEPHPSKEIIEEMASESWRMARIASVWAGYQIPPEMAFVTAIAEGGFHNLNRDRSPDPLHRSAGFFAEWPVCYTKFSKRAGLPYRPRGDSSAEEWSLEVCAHNRGHPLQQVKVYFTAMAFFLRQEGGDVQRVYSVWRWGYPTEKTYAARCERIWRKWFDTYPKNGLLSPR